MPRRDYNSSYLGEQLPGWEIGEPQPAVIELEERGEITGSVLDAGCGTGENALYFASKGHETTGADISEAAIQRALEKAKQRGINAKFIVHDALNLSALDATFDNIIDCGLFHTMDPDDRRVYAQNLAPIMHSQSAYFMLAFSDLEPTGYGPPNRISKQNIQEVFTEGWQIEYIKPATFKSNHNGKKPKAWLSKIVKV